MNNELEILNEGLRDYFKKLFLNIQATPKYKEYVRGHINNLLKGYEWMVKNTPELIEKAGGLQSFEAQLKIHDKSKFSKEELKPYAKHFYGSEKENRNDAHFKSAWEHHWRNNPHHPEYWDGKDMPYKYVLEMVLDWWTFSWRDGKLDEIFSWYEKHKDDERKNMSTKTKREVEIILNKMRPILAKQKEDLLEEKNMDYIEKLIQQKYIEENKIAAIYALDEEGKPQQLWKGKTNDLLENLAGETFVKFLRESPEEFNKPEYSILVESTRNLWRRKWEEENDQYRWPDGKFHNKDYTQATQLEKDEVERNIKEQNAKRIAENKQREEEKKKEEEAKARDDDKKEDLTEMTLIEDKYDQIKKRIEDKRKKEGRENDEYTKEEKDEINDSYSKRSARISYKEHIDKARDLSLSKEKQKEYIDAAKAAKESTYLKNIDKFDKLNHVGSYEKDDNSSKKNLDEQVFSESKEETKIEEYQDEIHDINKKLSRKNLANKTANKLSQDKKEIYKKLKDMLNKKTEEKED